MTAIHPTQEESAAATELTPTRKKIDLLRRYNRHEITLDQLTTEVFQIDNPPRGRFARGVILIGSILLAPIFSSTRSHQS